MKALIINCSPVKNGATAEITEIISNVLKEKYDIQYVSMIIGSDFVKGAEPATVQLSVFKRMMWTN